MALREWDAASYQRVSLPHEEWAEAIVARLPLRGTETVLDAGCGTGRVTRMLVERSPSGKVVAVDGSAAMVEKAREVLRPGDEAFAADLTELRLDAPVDAVVSSAVFHWIADHDLLFRRLRACMKPGARLAAQCGGAGNIADFLRLVPGIAAAEPFAARLGGFCETWYFAGTEESAVRLRAAGFEAVRCWLEPWDVAPPQPREFLRTIVLAPYLERLPADQHDGFLAAVLAAAGEPLRMRYVRLNIEATAAPADG